MTDRMGNVAIVDGHIRCCVCGETKPLDEYFASYVKQGNGRCRECCRRITPGSKAWSASASPDDLARYRASRVDYYQKNKTAILSGARRRQLAAYGITVEEYDQMLAAQDGHCACCGTAEPGGRGCMHVDHDHETGEIRGLICHNCNRAIGLLGDTLDGARKAVAYLERAPMRVTPSLRINLLKVARG